MASKHRYSKAALKRGRGGFVAVPHRLLRSATLARLSPYATKLLVDLLAQYRGNNNGDLCATWSLMKERGWRSKSTLNKAMKELLEKQLIVIARRGGRHKPHLLAVTFFAIDECKGKLDIKPTGAPLDTWTLNEPIRPPKLVHLPRAAGQ